MSWRMMLRTKDGSIHFVVTDPKSGEKWTVYPSSAFDAEAGRQAADAAGHDLAVRSTSQARIPR